MLNKAKCKDLLISDSTHPRTLDAMLDELVPSWLGWEPETVWAHLKKFTGREPSLLTKTKINAMRLLHASEGPWEDWEAFLPVCTALNNDIPNFEIAAKPDLPELFVAAKIMRGVREHPFSQEVARFIAAACLDAGVLFTPPPLEFVQSILDVVDYTCTRCGNVDIYDNGKCDTCGAPDSALVLVPRYFDWREVQRKWEDIRHTPLERIELEENLIDIHLHKLLNAYLYMVENEQQHQKELRHAQA